MIILIYLTLPDNILSVKDLLKRRLWNDQHQVRFKSTRKFMVNYKGGKKYERKADLCEAIKANMSKI